MKTLVLYGTLGCHLCEQALAMIAPLVINEYNLVEVDISDSDELMARYDIRIPVVVMQESEAEIGWPFDTNRFLSFLQSSP